MNQIEILIGLKQIVGQMIAAGMQGNLAERVESEIAEDLSSGCFSFYPHFAPYVLGNPYILEFLCAAMECYRVDALFFYSPTTVIPDRICGITTVSQIFASGIGLSRIPDNIHQMRNLTYLEVENNPIDEVPLCLGNMPMLKELFLRGTHVHEIPPALVHSGLEVAIGAGDSAKSWGGAAQRVADHTTYCTGPVPDVCPVEYLAAPVD